MHSTSIFVGWMAFGWGLFGLKLPLFVVNVSRRADELREPFGDRWAVRLVAAAMLPVSIGLIGGGLALVRWGFFGG